VTTPSGQSPFNELRQTADDELNVRGLTLTPDGDDQLNVFIRVGTNTLLESGKDNEVAKQNLRRYIEQVALYAASLGTSAVTGSILQNIAIRLCPLWPFC
jgi:hypothetical protein